MKTPLQQMEYPMINLLPCPFCGGEAERYDNHDTGSINEGGSCIQCKKCSASSPMHFDRKENLVSSWNDRAQTSSDAARRAYGILWREPTTSVYAKAARKELFGSLSHEERRSGIAWAMEMFGPMNDAEMIAADIRVGEFPAKSTDVS